MQANASSPLKNQAQIILYRRQSMKRHYFDLNWVCFFFEIGLRKRQKS